MTEKHITLTPYSGHTHALWIRLYVHMCGMHDFVHICWHMFIYDAHTHIIYAHVLLRSSSMWRDFPMTSKRCCRTSAMAKLNLRCCRRGTPWVRWPSYNATAITPGYVCTALGVHSLLLIWYKNNLSCSGPLIKLLLYCIVYDTRSLALLLSTL